MKGKHAILIQKSICRDSIVSNSNSTASLRRLFQQHRSSTTEPGEATPPCKSASPRKRPFGRHHGIIFWLISRAVEVPIFCLSDLNQSTAQATSDPLTHLNQSARSPCLNSH